MREDTWIDQAMKRYPKLFKNCYCGFDTGIGWENLLIEAFEELNKLDTINIVQIKEKFGTLRLYVGGSNYDQVDKIVDEAERKSAITCEYCGKPGKLRQTSWLKTLCDDCQANRYKK